MSDLTDEQMAWVRRLATLRAKRKAIEAAEAEAVKAIKQIAGTQRSLAYRGTTCCTITQVTQRRIDAKALREDHPDLAETYTVASVSTRVVPADGILG